jgi:hypothetical protein
VLHRSHARGSSRDRQRSSSIESEEPGDSEKQNWVGELYGDVIVILILKQTAAEEARFVVLLLLQ